MANAKNTPDSRMAGMAMMAPIGTATKPANSRATAQGRPSPEVKWPMAAAPTAAKAYWHSDTCPDTRTRMPNDRTRITSISPDE